MDSLIGRIRERIAEGRPNDFPNEWMPVQPPVDSQEMASAKRRLGFPLPELLRRMYLEIGNGGFGPVFGLLPMFSYGDWDFDLVGDYLKLARNAADGSPRRGWCPGMVPVFYYGGVTLEFVDCHTAGNPTVPLDLGADMEELTPVSSLAARLEMWLAGEQPW